MQDTIKPLVTVVIPVYNYGDKVARAIDSVKEQTLSNFECFVVDDGSTDNTKEAVEKAIDGDSRFKYIHKQNGGVATARNLGVFSGDAPYVCCLDADDALAPGFLEACVRYLEQDKTVGIAYTGLYYIKPDGSEGLSPWPGQYDYERQLEGVNQIPTCNVARREMWERLGGQRQRYAPGGAGEEDAELWLRAGAYGFTGKKVTNAGLFIYSWMTGRVSGSKEHRVTDYRAWHPWTKDKKHPFASSALASRYSHPVRQYDEPSISVVIPVGPGHEEYVIDALDSLDAQSFRMWEVIVVWDNPTSFEHIQKVYPFATILPIYDKKRGARGAGFARNRGVEFAKAPLLLFLDADDILYPNALEEFMKAWEQTLYIVYSDYVGKAVIEDTDVLQRLRKEGRLLFYDEKNKTAITKHISKDYDCALAQNQPDPNLYIWCLVTALIPKMWHNEIGGFDEEMMSWEDWDYFIRMSRTGHCFTRIPQDLVLYRFYTGGRRDDGLKDHKELFRYMTAKYEKEKVMGCNCGKGTRPAPPPPGAMATTARNEVIPMSDDQYVKVIYKSPNMGQHKVVGAVSKINYGYRSGGEIFLVHKEDVKVQPIFEIAPVEVEHTEKPQQIEEVPLPPPPVKIEEVAMPSPSENGTIPIEALSDFAGAPVVSTLVGDGVVTVDDLLVKGASALVKIKGIGPKKASLILAEAERIANEA